VNKFSKVVALSTMAMTLTSGISFAQDRPDDRNRPNNSQGGDPSHNRDQPRGSGNRDQPRDGGNRDQHRDGGHPYVHHQEWRNGYHMRDDDWRRGSRVDYRQNHLRRPPSGYEWREVDGNYVLGGIATGVIASVIIASTR
jgi:Ni/Co efflux regulator RcnB